MWNHSLVAASPVPAQKLGKGPGNTCKNSIQHIGIRGPSAPLPRLECASLDIKLEFIGRKPSAMYVFSQTLCAMARVYVLPRSQTLSG